MFHKAGLQKNVFLYQMTDVNESSSESNITVTGIKDFPTLRTHFFKKSLPFTIGKMHKTNTTQELGLTLTQFPQERILYVVEYFPPFMIDVSVDCRSTPLNVKQTNLQKVSDLCQKHRANSQVANGNSRLPHDRFEKQGGSSYSNSGRWEVDCVWN